jgi:hypothetical protein
MTLVLSQAAFSEKDQKTDGETVRKRSGFVARLRFVLHEPFFQFIALGFLIWAGVEYIEAQNERYVIHLGPAQIQRLSITYQQQYNQPPTPAQLKELTDRYVREEIFLREGLALNLDKDDEIVRRRIAQKFEFLQTDLGVPEPPSAQALAQWFERNKSHYLTPERVSFTQIYFSADRDGDAAARERARQALATLGNTSTARAPELGDSFPGPSDISALSHEEAERVFGQSALSDALFAAPIGRWSGPFRSGYGWHLVLVTGHQAPHASRLNDIRARVLADYMDAQRRDINDAAYQRLLSKYTIERDGSGK